MDPLTIAFVASSIADPFVSAHKEKKAEEKATKEGLRTAVLQRKHSHSKNKKIAKHLSAADELEAKAANVTNTVTNTTSSLANASRANALSKEAQKVRTNTEVEVEKEQMAEDLKNAKAAQPRIDAAKRKSRIESDIVPTLAKKVVTPIVNTGKAVGKLVDGAVKSLTGGALK